MPRSLLPVLVSAALGGVLIWFLLSPQEIELDAVPEVPRTPVELEAAATPLSFVTITKPPHASGAELRELHNRVVATLEEALMKHAAGETSLRAVEQIEMRLLAIRRKLGVVKKETFHEQMALLFERERTRIEGLAAMEPPRASARAVTLAKAFHARELHLSGKTTEANYAALRKQVLDDLKERLEFLAPARRKQRDSLQDQLDELRQALPEA